MPGVPPDAADKVKGLIKNLFKRGKNKNRHSTAAPGSSTDPTNTASQQQPPTSAQSPEAHTESGAAADTNKPLPATNSLATDEHSTPQEAVPQDHAALPGPPAGANDPTTKLDAQDVSPLSATQVDGSQQVSAIEKDATPAVPPKDVGNTDSSTAAPGIIHESFGKSASNQEAVTDENEAPTTEATETKHNSNLASKLDPAAPNPPAHDPAAQSADTAIISSVGPESTTAQLAGQVPKASDETSKSDAPQPAKVAPGMSATSGPLEDFPEGVKE